jgi:hypothetical protein
MKQTSICVFLEALGLSPTPPFFFYFQTGAPTFALSLVLFGKGCPVQFETLNSTKTVRRPYT